MKRVKGIDEFAFLLAAGSIMIVLMLLLWGEPSDNGENNITENVTNIFTIGAQLQDVPRNIRIGDVSVSYQVGSEVLTRRTNLEIRKGLLEDEHENMGAEIIRDMNLITDGFITLQVLDTNSEGNLVIEFNDQVIFEEKTEEGKIDIPIQKSLLKEYNVIGISTTGSGWKFWSNSYYVLDKVEFGINYFGRLEQEEVFTVYEKELENFQSGLVSFYVEDAQGGGDLIIEINGYEILRTTPSGTVNEAFELFDVGLVKGTNTITFSTEQGSSYILDNVNIVIIHEEMGQKTRSASFYVSSSDYNKLKRTDGEIEFYILDSNKLGSLSIIIEDSQGRDNPLRTISSYSIGELRSINFDSEDVEKGTNKVIFEASGEGTFVLGNLRIKI
jgi:hypothetical protein